MVPVSGDGASHQASSMEPRGMLKRKKSQKIAMEARIREFEKYIEVEKLAPDTEHCHNEAAWHNVPHPEERLRFWSGLDTEVKLAKNTGDSVFRMGVDWLRIMPKEPMDGLKDTVNVATLERYKWIIHRVCSYGMKVMLTLFHHSLLPWAGAYGGWKLERTVGYFMDFTRLVVGSVSDVVDYWVTFNAPHVLCLLTHCAGAWPSGLPDALEFNRVSNEVDQFGYEVLFSNWDSFGTTNETRNLESNKDAATNYLAFGIDPSKTSVCVQFHVRAHEELMGLLSSATPVGWLNRMIQFKEKSRKAGDKNLRVTLLLSPVSMASDIVATEPISDQKNPDFLWK
ncbi:hypothetical protein Nepgr_015690 [Nepenthes gracilis]|uniref:Uncharacterized protein n=1 Tax=Nepenthes gracilis TaxID=150966 RepID=A0AAD3SN88_NEPGR|nr:hypothetical protein Nepgr_015690 [Nepenthes gracilis]